MSPEPDTIIVVPCYNEGTRLRPDRFSEFVSATPGIRLLFVNDGSGDTTADVLNELKVALPGAIDVLHLPRNVGKGEAVRHGLLHALAGQPTYVGYWDADLATPLDAIPTFRAMMEDNPAIEILLGSRVKLLGRRIERHALRHYLGRVFATFASLTLRLPVYDTQCGAKLLRNTETLHAVLERPFESRWIFDVELLARWLKRRGRPTEESSAAPIQEYPVQSWVDVRGSKLAAADWLVAVLDLARIASKYR